MGDSEQCHHVSPPSPPPRSDCAILYNDRSVLENHHISAVFRMMQDDEMNIFVNLTKDEFVSVPIPTVPVVPIDPLVPTVPIALTVPMDPTVLITPIDPLVPTVPIALTIPIAPICPLHPH